jgi:serine/threonine-protein kinase
MPSLPQDDPIVRELETAVAGRYGLERELGRGGMGAVYLGRDLKLDRLVAIKVLPPELAVRPELRERFLRETRTAASFSHPNIVSVHGVEEIGALLFFVMTFVEGETLTQRVQRQGPLSVAEATRMLQEVAWALSYAHGRGVVHRDVKPDNILIERATGRAMVMDFGIARSVAASGLTQMGETVGTPHFMSPEQAAGDKLDGRSDLYSLGVVAYYAVTARLPFDAPSAQGIMVAHISQPAPAVVRARPDLPAPLAAVIDRCLLKDPAERFATGEALVEALEAIKLRRTEVAPSIRIFQQKAATTLFLLILAAILGGRLTQSKYDADQLVNRVFLLGILWAMFAQLVRQARSLRIQGFSPDEIQAGLRGITEEGNEERARLRASPIDQKRRRRRYTVAAVALAAGLYERWYMMNYLRTPVGDGIYNVSRPGILMAGASVVLIAIAIIQVLTDPMRESGIDWIVRLIFQGPIGRTFFRLVGWKIRTGPTGAAGATPTRHGALTMLDTLQGDDKRRLGKAARTTLERLEGEIERLERREKELEGAMTEAKVNAPTLTTGASDKQRALLDDLDLARRTAAERRVAILGAMESIRLSLVRVKSRLATVDDTEREIAEAAHLLEGSGR